MRVGALFDEIIAAKNLLDLFTGVENRDQLISRLERLKHRGTDELMHCIEEHRASNTALLDDQLEMSASMPTEEDTGFPDLDAADGETKTEPGMDALDRELDEIGRSLQPPGRALPEAQDDVDQELADLEDAAVPEPPAQLLEPPIPPAVPPAEVFVVPPGSTITPPAAPAPEKPNS